MFGRMVLGDDRNARAKPDGFRARQDVCDKDIVGGNGLPGHSVMLAHPDLGKTELIRTNDQLDVLFETLRPVLLWRMQGHHEHPKFHWIFSSRIKPDFRQDR